jgi:hypothetical protein
MKAAGKTETPQEYTQEWLELDERDPGFQLMAEENAVIIHVYFLYIFISTTYIIKLSIYLLFFFFWLPFASSIRIICYSG